MRVSGAGMTVYLWWQCVCSRVDPRVHVLSDRFENNAFALPNPSRHTKRDYSIIQALPR